MILSGPLETMILFHGKLTKTNSVGFVTFLIKYSPENYHIAGKQAKYNFLT